MKKFFNTLAVFLGNLLRLKPTTWSKSQTLAELMVANARTLAETAVLKDDEQLSGETPFSFFVNCAINALAFVVAVWLIAQIITFFMVLLPYLVGAVFALWAISYLLPSKGKVTAS